VNGIDCRRINHFEAVKFFKESDEFLIVAKYSPNGNSKFSFCFVLFKKKLYLSVILFLILDYKRASPQLQIHNDIIY
jgi:hypothetical protein